MRKEVKLTWYNTKMKIDLHEVEQLQNFIVSDLALKFNSSGTKFEALQVHFHSPSEHTLNGKHYDLEMHIFHRMVNNGSVSGDKNDVDSGVIALMFSVEDFNKEIDGG